MSTEQKIQQNQQPRIKLNIGGKIFETTAATLNKYPESVLANLFAGENKLKPDENGVYFIDRDGSLFGYVLNFLRDDNLALPSNQYELEQLEREARSYGLTGLENLVVGHRKELQNRWNQQPYVAPQSSGTSFGLSNTGSLSYSSGSGFGYGIYSAPSTASSNSFEVTSFDPNSIHHPTSSQDDPAHELFAGSTISGSNQENKPSALNIHDSPFGPPLTTSYVPQNIQPSLDGPFGPPLSSSLFQTEEIPLIDDDSFLAEPKNLSEPSLYESELGNEDGGF
eukprot:TRINITY_DN230_c0_g3_i1.p1 TRINITY_DN230_c0_g3~~TRINITY_DN230_c0_g3_i1.p1  ORF type:complete len:305 (-),score=75.15 TRINITY_DN230_c0_g3_i1:129-971(-)